MINGSPSDPQLFQESPKTAGGLTASKMITVSRALRGKLQDHAKTSR